MNTSKWDKFSREDLQEVLDLKLQALSSVNMVLDTIKRDPNRPEMDARVLALRAAPEQSARELEADIATLRKIFAEKFFGK
jgi:hypothetical protein